MTNNLVINQVTKNNFYCSASNLANHPMGNEDNSTCLALKACYFKG